VQALVMFFSYLLSGFFVLVPYIIFSPSVALPVSIAISIAILFMLGAYSGKVARVSVWKNGVTMAVIGGAAILIGMSAGIIIEQFTGSIF